MCPAQHCYHYFSLLLSICYSPQYNMLNTHLEKPKLWPKQKGAAFSKRCREDYRKKVTLSKKLYCVICFQWSSAGEKKLEKKKKPLQPKAHSVQRVRFPSSLMEKYCNIKRQTLINTGWLILKENGAGWDICSFFTNHHFSKGHTHSDRVKS